VRELDASRPELPANEYRMPRASSQTHTKLRKLRNNQRDEIKAKEKQDEADARKNRKLKIMAMHRMHELREEKMNLGVLCAKHGWSLSKGLDNIPPEIKAKQKSKLKTDIVRHRERMLVAQQAVGLKEKKERMQQVSLKAEEMLTAHFMKAIGISDKNNHKHKKGGHDGGQPQRSDEQAMLANPTVGAVESVDHVVDEAAVVMELTRFHTPKPTKYNLRKSLEQRTDGRQPPSQGFDSTKRDILFAASTAPRFPDIKVSGPPPNAYNIDVGCVSPHRAIPKLYSQGRELYGSIYSDVFNAIGPGPSKYNTHDAYFRTSTTLGVNGTVFAPRTPVFSKRDEMPGKDSTSATKDAAATDDDNKADGGSGVWHHAIDMSRKDHSRFQRAKEVEREKAIQKLKDGVLHVSLIHDIDIDETVPIQ